jgi:hypothetical protein
VPLPTTPTVNQLSPERLRAILFSRPGAGKTSLAAGWYPATNLIIDLEGGTRFLPGEHFVEQPTSYSAFQMLIHELCTTQHQFTTVTIDTVDKLVRMADAEAGQRGGKVSAGLVEYGRGLADRDGTLMRDLARLLATDLGVILCAHAVTVGVKQEDGTEIERTFPRIEPGDAGDRLRQPIMGEFDYVLAVQKAANETRSLITGGHVGVETKVRHTLPHVLPLPADPAQGAGVLYAAVAAGIEALGVAA